MSLQILIVPDEDRPELFDRHVLAKLRGEERARYEAGELVVLHDGTAVCKGDAPKGWLRSRFAGVANANEPRFGVDYFGRAIEAVSVDGHGRLRAVVTTGVSERCPSPRRICADVSTWGFDGPGFRAVDPNHIEAILRWKADVLDAGAIRLGRFLGYGAEEKSAGMSWAGSAPVAWFRLANPPQFLRRAEHQSVSLFIESDPGRSRLGATSAGAIARADAHARAWHADRDEDRKRGAAFRAALIDQAWGEKVH